MNYILHYEKLIKRAKDRKIEGYVESHHIIPKCMNGSDDKDNLVNLTAREHFIAHLLLLKIYPKNFGLIKAVNMMCCSNSKQRRSMNRMYGWLREKFSEEMSSMQKGNGNSQYGTIWISCIETKENKKISKNEAIPIGWYKGRNLWKKIEEKEQKLLIKKQKFLDEKIIAEKLFSEYIKSGVSIRKFAKESDYKYSHVALTIYFKKYIEDYDKYIIPCKGR